MITVRRSRSVIYLKNLFVGGERRDRSVRARVVISLRGGTPKTRRALTWLRITIRAYGCPTSHILLCFSAVLRLPPGHLHKRS